MNTMMCHTMQPIKFVKRANDSYSFLTLWMNIWMQGCYTFLLLSCFSIIYTQKSTLVLKNVTMQAPKRNRQIIKFHLNFTGYDFGSLYSSLKTNAIQLFESLSV